MTIFINVALRVAPWVIATACGFIAADQMTKRREEAQANAALVRALKKRIEELTRQIHDLANTSADDALVHQLRTEWMRLRTELAARLARECEA